MTDGNDDMKWVEAQQPPVDPPDRETTMRVRAALLAHADKSRRLAALDGPIATAPRRRRLASFRKSRRGWAAAAAVAVMVIAGVTTLLLGIPGTSNNGPGTSNNGPGTTNNGLAASTPGTSNNGLGTSSNRVAVSIPAGTAEPLAALVSRVLASPAQTGNATLVLHTNAFTDGKSFTGADLYLDDGRYYYAQTAAGLPESAKGDPIDFDLKPAIEAAASVAHDVPEPTHASQAR